MGSVVVPYNNRLQRTVIRRRGRAAHAARCTCDHAAAEPERSASVLSGPVGQE
jgi:hypothetical protein